MKKMPYVTVAVSAFNEEKNILPFLRSVLKQEERGFKLKGIWVYSDGSEDKTAEKARSLKNKKIRVFSFKDRIGKSSRLNQIYKSLMTELLVQSDCDVAFDHPLVIHDLIQPLIKEKDVGMCGGNPVPAKAVTFIEKAVNCSFEPYQKLRWQVRGGDNIFSVDGRILAYKKELLKKIYVPEDMIANDAFTYYCCLTQNYKYRFVKTAVVVFRSPQTLRDQIRQNTRFESAEARMERYFPKTLVKKESKAPKWLLFANIGVQFLKHPVLSLTVLVINQYCRFKARLDERKLTAKWSIAVTTKRLSV